MKRRDVITLLSGAAAACPARARARAQQPAMPVVGYMSSRSAAADAAMLDAVRRGLNDAGYVAGRNVAIEYRFADAQYDRLSALLSDYTRRRVDVIVFGGADVALDFEDTLRQMRSSPVPIVFNTGNDPVRAGLVASMNRPGGNLTGVASLAGELSGKQLGLLHDLLPKAATIAVLVDPGNSSREVVLKDTRAAAATLGQQLLVLSPGTIDAIDAAFATLSQQPVDAVLVSVSPFFLTRAQQIIALAARHRVPVVYYRREYVQAGGLMSYGFNVADSYREMGRYAGRILKGDKPADLPVLQPTRFEFVVNLKTAETLGITIPPGLLAIVDEVIE